MSTQAHRAWMVTINNPKIPGDKYLEQWMADGVIVFGCGQQEEAPETGTPHHQLYIVTVANPKNKNGYTIKWLKEHIHSSAHYDPRRGTHQEAVDYCTSPEYKGKVKIVLAGPWSYGKWSDTEGPSKGGVKGGGVNASKILAVKTAIDNGVGDGELYQQHFGEMLRYGKGFDRYRMTLKNKMRKSHTYAFCFYGPPGTGKSKMVSDMAEANFGDDIYYLDISGDTIWWDGYSGQKCVVIEEFYGQMKIGYLLKLLDRHPLQVQTKGSYVPFVGEVIFFTSNEHPNMWYGKGAAPGEPSKIPLDVLNALKRRFEGKCGKIVELKDKLEIVDDEPTADELYEVMLATTQSYLEQDKPTVLDITSDDDVDDKVARREIVDGVDITDYDEADREAFFMGRQEDAYWQEEAREMLAAGDYPSPSYEGDYVGGDSDFEDGPPLSQAQKLRRTDTSRFELMPPPKAPASEFRKMKQIPGQSKIVVHKVNDDED